MPEGAEVRFLKEYMEKYILDKTLTKITSLGKKKVKYNSKSSSNSSSKSSSKNKVLEVGCKGKLLWIKFKDFYIEMHMMLTGWIYINEEPEHPLFILEFSSNTKMYIDSLRRFTYIKICSYEEHEEKINSLGIDILTKQFTFDNFYKIL